MKLCKQCIKEYVNVYQRVDGSTYTRDTNFCSKSCATTHQRGSINKTQLLLELEEFIITKNRYCYAQEVYKTLGRSSKTYVKHSIKIEEVNTKLGFYKKGSYFSGGVYSFLIKHFDNVERETSFNGLLSPKLYPLRIDFFIPEKQLVIEADGVQHHQKGHPWNDAYRQECDKIKDVFFEKMKYSMVRVPYIKKVSDAYLLSLLHSYI
jgi:hypothetical protein